MEHDAVGPDSAWHSMPVADVLQQLESDQWGLKGEEAKHRLRVHGHNRLPTARGRNPLVRFFSHFNNVLIYVLLVAAVGSAAMGHWADAAVILGVVVINALIGFIQEGKAEKALHALRQMLSQKATVMRDGRRQEVAAEDLVPGDLVFIQAGDKVPADLRLLQSRNLRIEEAALTGESVPVEKGMSPVAPDTVLAERSSIAYSSTLVTYGQGSGVVVATGAQTEIGRISALLEEVTTLETPLLRQLTRFGQLLTLWIVGLGTLTFIFGWLARDYTLNEMFLAAVGLVVAAIPEGLPAIITITLAIGVQRMAARHAIIRRLPAVETLGSVSVICSDKTGTLTRNEMTVKSVALAKRFYEVSGVGYDPHGTFNVAEREVDPDTDAVLRELVRAALLCNDASVVEREGAWTLQGDPTEGALVTLALKAGLDPTLTREEYPRTDVIPFESEHRFMATLHHDHAGHSFAVVKGAPERLFEMCRLERVNGEDRPLNIAAWIEQVEQIAARGQRTLALALRVHPPSPHELRFTDVQGDLTLLGVVGLIDPPREEAVRAVALCQSAGIQVKMITGDHAGTAHAIGEQMGLTGGDTDTLTGAALQTMSSEQLEEAVEKTCIFARTSPEDKLRLVQALQARGRVAAMTGDGVNDAPALKRADVGVAMGINGTEVAKEAAEMVLTDDNFASIANAVEEGRTVYDNIKKAVLFILPTNGAQALTIIAAIAAGVVLPITPLQILWVNMVTAVTLALALAFEPAEQDVMQRPPREPSEPLLNAFMVWRIIFVSVLMVMGVFGLFLWEREAGMAIEGARTVAVNALVTFEIAYLINSRHITASVLNRDGFFGNPYALLAILLVVTLQLLFTYLPPMQQLFGTAAVGNESWARIVSLAIIIFVLIEAEKAIVRRWSLRRAKR